MRKLFFIAVIGLLAIASCTKKSSPTAASKTDELAKEGSPIYAQNCSRCHGATGVEGRAPNLAKNEFTKNELVDKITQGGGRMPAFSTKLSAKEIEAVAEFTIRLRK
jgi:mono/diheme cytochrome c family protein